MFSAPDGAQKNQELAKAHDDLAAAKSYVENIIGSMADTLLVIDSAMIIGSVNASLLRLLGYDQEELVGEPPGKIFGEELAHGSILEVLLREGAVSNVETTYLAKDGRSIPVSLSGSLMRDERGHIQGLVCVAQDITERKRMEEEKRQLNEQLMETSRRLGMADVATSVLHNVGNVLNSINVSVGLLQEVVRKSLVGDVGRVAALLQEHKDHLGNYLTHDDKGKRIPEYLSHLGNHLGEEYRVMYEELEGLSRNTEHAKQCIAMQQGVAKSGGLQEAVVLQDLVEQALEINKDALQQQGVELLREYTVPWEIMVDRHQVLQIVVNLIRNAIQAMKPCDRRLLTVRVRPSPENRAFLRLEVGDTGTGIPPELLTRIFTQGFTTKPDGHGFGLHSSALLAKNMGGSLRAESQGPGSGSTFILELPITSDLSTE